MPVNTNLNDARTTQLTPIPRVICDLGKLEERIAFLAALKTAFTTTSSKGLIYIASIAISQTDRDAAERIAWLRVNTFEIGAIPKETDIIGALGEWAILRLLKLDASVKPVSLVSLAPESKPDFVVEYRGIEAMFDIKTTSSIAEPSAVIDPVRHQSKGDPHVIGVCLNAKWKNIPQSADIFFVNSEDLMTPANYEAYCLKINSRPDPVLNLKGYLE